MNHVNTYLFAGLRHAGSIRIFRKALHAFLLYQVLVYLWHFESLFGAHGMVYTKPIVWGGFKDIVYLFNIYDIPAVRLAFLIMTGLICIAGLLNIQSGLSNLLLALAVYNIHNYLYQASTAGDFLLNQFLFFNCFLFTKPLQRPVFRDLQVALHNTSFMALRLQVCLAYALAAYYKLCDPDWLSGEAVYQSLQTDIYSNGVLKSIPHSLTVFMNYFTMTYQVLFSAIVWIKPLKKWVLWLGVAQHLFLSLIHI